MSATGAVTLGEQAGRVERLEVRCRRCDRHGRLRLARLIADHGAGTGLPEGPDARPGHPLLRALPPARRAVLTPGGHGEPSGADSRGAGHHGDLMTAVALAVRGQGLTRVSPG